MLWKTGKPGVCGINEDNRTGH